MNTFYKYLISLSALLLIGVLQLGSNAGQDISINGIEQSFSSAQKQNITLAKSDIYFQANHSNSSRLYGVESSESGAEEDENKSSKKFSAFSDFLQSLLILQKAAVSLDLHTGREVLHSHSFKSFSYKSIFLVLEVFRL